MRVDDWFLAAGERGNEHSGIDRRHDGVPWTEGNHAEILVDGDEYFARLYSVLCATAHGDSVFLTGLEDDADERLAGPGTEIADVLGELLRRGVRVCGMVWRSHAAVFAQRKNVMFSRAVNSAGGEVLLDNRIRRGGSHHQKIVVVRHETRPGDDRPADDVAFVGGMDLVHGRHDDGRHLGDPQPADLDPESYSERPGWHDVQVALHGPVVDDVAFTFRERWEDPAPVDTRTPLRWVMHRLARQPPAPAPLAAERAITPRVGPHAVQVLRTYPARYPPYPFAPKGERSVARAYIKVFGRARRLIYLEDQYLWSFHATRVLCDALRREPDLLVVIVIPKYPDPGGRFAAAASVFGRERVQDALYAVGGDRVAIYDLERDDGTAVYVHSKACIVDDTWMAIGSDNLNRRSWTHDSEISCAILDETRDEREPRDPAGRGEGARKLARDARLRLAREHTCGAVDVDDMIDAGDWFAALRRSAAALDAWHREGKRGIRPPGHLRAHAVERVDAAQHGIVGWVHTHLLDPDGRPRRLKRSDSF
jgi:phosphatidylserine/phosphatidylglycerophosphate/cardiolipin synthase-like enzyme